MFSLAALLWLQAGDAAAAIGAARVIVNKVDAQLDERERALAPRDEVFSNEVIRTAMASASHLRFRDETELKIGPESEVVLDRFVYSEADAQEVAVSIAVGLLRFTSGKLRKSAYTLRTPTATVGVRGTVFDLLVGADGATTIVAYAGEALFQAGNGEDFVVGPCQMMSVGPTGEPIGAEPQSAVRLSGGGAARIFEMQRLLEDGGAPDEPSLQDCLDPAAGGEAGAPPPPPFGAEESPEDQAPPDRLNPGRSDAFGFGGPLGGPAPFNPPLPSPFADSGPSLPPGIGSPGPNPPPFRPREPDPFLGPAPADVPEPGSWPTLLLLLAILIASRRRRRD